MPVTISFDVESISLTGDAFAVGAVTSDGRHFFALLPDAAYEPCQWVKDSVMPAIRRRVELEVQRHVKPHEASYFKPGEYDQCRANRAGDLHAADYRGVCLRFFDWVTAVHATAPVTLVADWGMPVEGRFWADCLRFAAERLPGSEFAAPAPVHEVATAMLVSVIHRNKELIFTSPGYGGTEHDPVYDAAVSLRDWLAATK